MAEKVNKELTKSFNKGLRSGREEMKNNIIKDITNDIPWIGEKRSKEIIDYINKKYAKLNYVEE